MKLKDSDKKELVNDIKKYFENNEDSLKAIFSLNGEIFGDNFYCCISGSSFETRIINLVQELTNRRKIFSFIDLVKKTPYPDFAKFLRCLPLKSCIDELIDILDGDFETNKEVLLKVYQRTRPNYAIATEISPKNSIELINGLNLPQGNQVYSYIEEFIGYLLERENSLSLSLRTNLRIWAEKNINDYDRLREQLNQKEQERNQMIPCLLIAITSLGNNYIVEGFLIKNLKQYNRNNSNKNAFPNFQQLIIKSPNTDKKLINVEKIVRDLIQECINITENNPEQIHVFLPYELMNHPVECWKAYENENETIGESYVVFIRCSEGLRGKDPRVINWRKKGVLLNDKLQKYAEEVFVLGDTQEEKTLEKELRQKKALAVKITTVFQKSQPGELVWKAAVPLALWIRQQLDGIDNQLELDRLLSNCRLQQLPEKVKNERLDIIDKEIPEDHLGRHICLLWDDPNLLPPEQVLTEIKL